MSMRRMLSLIPITIFIVLVGFFAYRLQLIGKGDTPNLIPSVMINRQVPFFSIPSFTNGKPAVTTQTFTGKVTLINFFASWCLPCRAEHPYLMELKKTGINIVGINYKDKTESARSWLVKLGDPFTTIGVDPEGRLGIDFGVYGVPESYLIDKHGIIRYKQTGPLTPEDIQTKLLPLVEELNK